jgi:hypothetical protein
MNKAKLSALCAKVMGYELKSYPAAWLPQLGDETYYYHPDGTCISHYDPLDDANQADDLLEYVADGRGWEGGHNLLLQCYWCRIGEGWQPSSAAETQNLAKIICALRASPEVTDAEINDAWEGK